MTTTTEQKQRTVYPTTQHGDVCHFELPYENADRIKKFYSEIFGWTFQDMPEMNYTLWHSHDQAIGGGFYKPTAEMPKAILTYLQVDSIETTIAKIRDRGGKVIKEKTEVPGAGWLAVVTDTEGNAIGLWKNDHSHN